MLSSMRAMYKQRKILERNAFCKSLGICSKFVSFKYEEFDIDVELSLLLAISFSVVGDETIFIEPNEIPRGDTQVVAQSSILKKLVALKPYRKFDNVLERAEFFFLNFVSFIPDKFLAMTYKNVKDIFVPYDQSGKPVVMNKGVTQGIQFNACPKDVQVSVKPDCSIEVGVKALKNLSQKITESVNMRGCCQSMFINDLSKSDFAVYLFVQMLVKLPEVYVPVVSKFTGNVNLLSNLLVSQGVTLYYKDSVEKPRYGSNKRYFNDFLVLLTDTEIKGACYINYSVSEFSPNLRRLEDQIGEYKNSDVNKGFHIFRCPREYASAYSYGYPDYSSLNTVWVTIFQSELLQKSIRYMLWYHTTYLMSGSFISKDKAIVLGLRSIKVDKPSGNNDEEEVYTAFKTDIEEKESESVLVEKKFSRGGKYISPDNGDNADFLSNNIKEIKSNPSNNKQNVIEKKESTLNGKVVAPKGQSPNNNNPSLTHSQLVAQRQNEDDDSAEEPEKDEEPDDDEYENWQPGDIDEGEGQ